MKSSNLFQLFEKTLNKGGVCYSTGSPLFLGSTTLQKFGVQTLTTLCPPVEDLSLSNSYDSSFEEIPLQNNSSAAKTNADNETDFAYIKTNYTVN